MSNLLSFFAPLTREAEGHDEHSPDDAGRTSAAPGYPRAPLCACGKPKGTCQCLCCGSANPAARRPPRVPPAGNSESGNGAPAALSLAAFQAITTEVPVQPRPGSLRDPLMLPEQTLTHYAEEYKQYSTPWKHLVGIEIPNFFQFVVWHERVKPVSRETETTTRH